MRSHLGLATVAGLARRAAVLLALMLASTLSACDSEDAPFLAFDGGGFIFNYRIAEAFYGVNVRPMRRLAPGMVLEAEFEDPAGGPTIIVRETIVGDRLRYSFRTPALRGVRAGVDYRVRVRLLERELGRELASYERTIRSDLDQLVLPDRPLTVGPGYLPNPDIGAERPR